MKSLRSWTRRNLSRVLIFTAAAFAFAIHASAAPVGGGLPWEAPMTAIATSLTGPVAYAIGLIGIAIAGGTMLWGGDLGEVGRKACMVGLVVAVCLFHGQLGRAVHKPIPRILRIRAEQLLQQLPDLVSDLPRYDPRYVESGRAARTAVAERASRADFASNNGADLGRRDGGAAGAR